MSFDRFLLAVESRDLSQADKKSYTKKLFGTWQFGKIEVFVNFIIQKFARSKSSIFFSFSGER